MLTKKMINDKKMKNIFGISVIFLLICFGAVSCKKDDNSSPDASANVNADLQQGKWSITLYNDNGVNETNHYTGYDFQFSNTGVITAIKSGNTTPGSWSSGNDDSQLKLILNFGSVTPFSELNDDWHVTLQNSSIIKLEDVSGGNGGTDYLTFEKI